MSGCSIGSISHFEPQGGICKGENHPVRQLSSVCFQFHLFPNFAEHIQSPRKTRRLDVVGLEHETYPRASVTLWLPGARANFSQNVVIRLLNFPQMFLDTTKFRLQDSLSGEDQSLKTSGHPAIAIGKGMNHYQIEMGHCCADHLRSSRWCIEIVNELLYKTWDKLSFRGLVNDLILGLIAHVNRAGPPIAWMFIQIVRHHHVVQAAYVRLMELEVGIFGELQDIRHGVPIANQGHACFLADLYGLFAFYNCNGIFDAGVVPLNTV